MRHSLRHTLTKSIRLAAGLLILAPLCAAKPASSIVLSPMTAEQKSFWNPMFISFTDRAEATVHDVIKDKLFVHTAAGLLTSEPTLTIKGDGAKVLATFRLKEASDNGDQFMIDLDAYGISLTENKLYELAISGAFRKKLYAYVRKVPPAIEREPLTAIAYNAIAVDCENISSSMVDYYGRINEGVPPFHYMWIVYRDSRENHLYQPAVGKTVNLEEVPGITVEQPLGYTVVFAVRDACGNYVEKYLNMQCGADDNYGNTIFLQTTPNTKSDPNQRNSN